MGITCTAALLYLVSTIEACEPHRGRNKVIMREMLISEWDSILVSHPEIDDIVAQLCDSSITIDEAIELLISTINDSR